MNYYHSHYIKEISICSLSDQYSENIPINPIRRVYEEDNELKFRYVSEKYTYSRVGYTRSWKKDLLLSTHTVRFGGFYSFLSFAWVFQKYIQKCISEFEDDLLQNVKASTTVTQSYENIFIRTEGYKCVQSLVAKNN